ncbi:oryzain alpha chain-like [Lolium rigidum]|uniref:oryzain alpha chain-like n=1 Tax=Lolium rigidum TaxID=89674 RepID=UPI001F5D358D|nr:oryzain alpha chain-like [Lolium rigidum]
MRSPTAVMAVAALLLLLVTLAAADTTVSSHREQERIAEDERRVMGEWLAKDSRSCREGSEEEDRRLFAEWMAEHGKKYKDAGEEMRRYAFFKDTLRRMDQYKAVLGRNSVIFVYNGPFSDLSHEEWRAMTCGMLRNDDEMSCWMLHYP